MITPEDLGRQRFIEGVQGTQRDVVRIQLSCDDLLGNPLDFLSHVDRMKQLRLRTDLLSLQQLCPFFDEQIDDLLFKQGEEGWKDADMGGIRQRAQCFQCLAAGIGRGIQRGQQILPVLVEDLQDHQSIVRILILSLCLRREESLVLLAVPALSEETFATCQIPQGAESLFVTEAGAFEAPDGLEGMYALMLDANSLSDVYLTRMRYGRALASISCTSGVEPGTAQELLSLWPDVAARIAQEALYVNDDPSCAQVDTVFGYEAMVISTDIAVGEQSMTLLDAWCVAFYNGPDLIEVWTVYPSAPAYLYDGEAAQELESDRADLEAFIASLSFPPYDTQEE